MPVRGGLPQLQPFIMIYDFPSERYFRIRMPVAVEHSPNKISLEELSEKLQVKIYFSSLSNLYVSRKNIKRSKSRGNALIVVHIIFFRETYKETQGFLIYTLCTSWYQDVQPVPPCHELERCLIIFVFICHFTNSKPQSWALLLILFPSNP